MAAILQSLIFLLLTIQDQLVHGGGLHKRLQYYETLHSRDLFHQTLHKRSAELNSVFSNQKIVSFNALGRDFRLHLKKQRNLVGRTFKASAVYGNSSTEDIHIDLDIFLEGYVQDDPKGSRVRAHYEGSDLVATIWTKEDVYAIEPSWRHLPTSDEYTMIAYKASDLITDRKRHPEDHIGASFCGHVHPDHDDAAYNRYSNADSSSKSGYRTKRQADTTNTCPVMLVADYHFYTNVGGGTMAGSATYLMGVIARVDAIYRGTDFGDNYNDMGVEIQGLTIHPEPTDVASGQMHYNMQQDVWDTSTLLETFGTNQDWSDYCLAHLFTYLAFSDGVLGLGWIASSSLNQAGGICSPVASGIHYNTAWTSHSNKYGNRLLTLESDLVTAHEFGHNWGSPHDPSGDECTPGSDDGGKYLMYTYSVSGYESNNDLFSPCSKRSMLAVLKAKVSKCFTEKSLSYCGNFVVEEDEECDAGGPGQQGLDPCCDSDCTFKAGAVCSDSNSLCCQNCQAAPATYVCSQGNNSTTSCTGSAKCDGTSFDCPAPENKKNGSPCVDEGECEDGVCIAFCEKNNKVSCICDEVEDSCKYCCRDDADAACVAYGADTGNTIDLADGKSCLQGSCLAGVCQTEIRSVTDRLWSVISDLSVDLILEIMRDNIVIATVLISLVLYIPFAVVVCCIDRKRNKLEKDTVEWHNRDNDKLISDKDSRVVRPTHRRQRPVKRNTGSLSAGPV